MTRNYTFSLSLYLSRPTGRIRRCPPGGHVQQRGDHPPPGAEEGGHQRCRRGKCPDPVGKDRGQGTGVRIWGMG